MITKDEINKLAKQLQFDLPADLEQEVDEAIVALMSRMEQYQKVDTDGVKPMFTPLEKMPSSVNLSYDDVVDELSDEDIINMAPQTKDHFVMTEQVINHDEN